MEIIYEKYVILKVKMLTKTDLKLIEGVIKKQITPLRKDIGILKLDVGVLKKDVVVLKQDIKREAKKTRKTFNTMLAFFDRDYSKLRQRVSFIEDHLNIVQV